jgi:hypothetical protein
MHRKYRSNFADDRLVLLFGCELPHRRGHIVIDDPDSAAVKITVNLLNFYIDVIAMVIMNMSSSGL